MRKAREGYLIFLVAVNPPFILSGALATFHELGEGCQYFVCVFGGRMREPTDMVKFQVVTNCGRSKSHMNYGPEDLYGAERRGRDKEIKNMKRGDKQKGSECKTVWTHT